MSESCANCKYGLTIETWDYTDVKNHGVPKHKEEGYACMIFASDRLCVHMVGCDPKKEMCECYMGVKDDTE